MEPGKYGGRGTMGEFARASTDRVVARLERSAVINGVGLQVTDGDGIGERKYVDLSVGAFKFINHHHSGLLYLVATNEDERARYVPALQLDADTLPTVVAD
jgi:hypothetical protein